MGQVLGTNIQNGCYLFLLYSYGELHMRKVLLNILTMSRKVLKNVLLSHINYRSLSCILPQLYCFTPSNVR